MPEPDNDPLARASVVDEVQARLDSYKTDKERKKRAAELEMLGKSAKYVGLDVAIEFAALMFRLKGRRMTVTAKQVSDDMFQQVCSGAMRTAVNVDGEHRPIPAEVFARSRPN